MAISAIWKDPLIKQSQDWWIVVMVSTSQILLQLIIFCTKNILYHGYYSHLLVLPMMLVTIVSHSKINLNLKQIWTLKIWKVVTNTENRIRHLTSWAIEEVIWHYTHGISAQLPCELCLQRLANQRGAPHTTHGQHLSKIEKISVLPILTYSDCNDF